MSNTNDLDTVAGIAARGADLGGMMALVEPQPPVLPDIRLDLLESGDGGAFVPRPAFGASELVEALDQARREAQVYLQDLSPPLPVTRTQHQIGQAEWRLEPETDWREVSLPHYGGPIGRARAWYRMRVNLDVEQLSAGSLWVCFGGVDYKAAVFWNGQLVGTHEGFFSPFECDITDCAVPGDNELLVRVDNDAICMGNKAWGQSRQGDKIYAATGLGWNDPFLGWSHCPPGMGIHRPVRIETRPAVHVGDLSVRPLLDEDAAEAWIEVFNRDTIPVALKLVVEIHGRNFECTPVTVSPELPEADSGVNRYRVRIPLPAARRWTPTTPWLYQLQVRLEADGKDDTGSRQFGMRSFVLDESPGPDGNRGRFLLNGLPIRLRGSNTMGHEQQCVFHGDLDQLRDDLLLAKLAHMNFLRFTQRPVEPEVYDLCDSLGLMAQTDLPLFSYLRRNQFSEALRQAVEMERLIRSHPSCVLVSFINEPFPFSWGDMTHRHLTRTELLGFFTAATQAILVENPDRQIKPIDGDYEPPGPGLPDNHCYTGWYANHGIDFGKLHAGYWQPVKPGWNYGCGEFGAEGLDFEDLMRECYPAEWLPRDTADESCWTPSRIKGAQSGGHHHLWFEAAESMSGWIARSQAHQQWATRMMTEALRRDNRMVSFASHLFIDAFPAGWMKTIMDCRRRPKPAYFAYREALTPLAANLRLNRTAWFSGESLQADVWILNDSPDVPDHAMIACQLERDGRIIASGRAPARVGICEAVFQGRMAHALPEVDARETLQLRLALLDGSSRVLHDTVVDLELFPRAKEPRKGYGGATALGGTKAALLAAALSCPDGVELIISDDPAQMDSPAIKEALARGATVLLTELPMGCFAIAGSTIRVEHAGMGPRYFVARDLMHPIAQSLRENDLRFWHDPQLGYPAPLLHDLFFADDSWTPILHSGQGGWGLAWSPALAAAEKSHGGGRVILCQVTLAGRLDNPAARLLADMLIEWP